MFCTRHSNASQDVKEAQDAEVAEDGDEDEDENEDFPDQAQKPNRTNNLCAQCALFMMRAILRGRCKMRISGDERCWHTKNGTNLL